MRALLTLSLSHLAPPQRLKTAKSLKSGTRQHAILDTLPRLIPTGKLDKDARTIGNQMLTA